MTRRVERLNSLLREVISEVLSRDLHHVLHIQVPVTITNVEITSDLSYAKVFFTLIGDEKLRSAIRNDLNAIASKIRALSIKKVRMHTFPRLEFFMDEGLDKQLRIHDILSKLEFDRSDEST